MQASHAGFKRTRTRTAPGRRGFDSCRRAPIFSLSWKKRNVRPPLMLPIPPRAWDSSPTRAAASPAAAAMAAGRGLLGDIPAHAAAGM